MSYDNGSLVTHRTVAITTTAAAATYAIRGPKGMQGRLVDVIATCTTSHVLGTTKTALLIGKSGATNAYGTYEPKALTAATGVDTLGAKASSASKVVPGHVIPADSEVLLTTVQNAGGLAAGVLLYDVLIEWS